MSIQKKAFSGVIWTFIDIVFAKGISIAAAVLLARLLTPRDFGLMGMIYIFTNISSTLVDSGMNSSLIRSQDADTKDFSTVFYSNIGLSTLLYVIIFACAPWIANFYNEPELTIIVRVYALFIIITSFASVQHSILSKAMNFKKLMLLNLPGNIIGSIAGITMAYQGYGVWSIIAMHLLTQAVFSLLLWVVSDWKPRLFFSKLILKKHFSFGYKLMIANLINSGFTNLYNVIIGKFYTTQQLGQYERAKSFSAYPLLILTSVIGKVTYPLMSSIQNETERLKRTYVQILKLSFFISVPILLTLSVVSKPLFLLALGKQWEEASIFFSILCLAGILYPLSAFNLNLIKVHGRSDWFLKLEIIKKSLLLVVLAVTFSFGVYVLVWGAVVVSVTGFLINAYYTSKLINYKVREQLLHMVKTIALGCIMYASMYFMFIHLRLNALYLQIVITSSVGFLFYISFAMLLKSKELSYIINLLQSQLKSK